MNAQGNRSAGDSADANDNDCGQKPRNSPYRTKLCRNYPLGSCRYGDYCSYLHIVPSPSPITHLAPSMHTIARSIFYPSISPMVTLPHSGTPYSAPSYPAHTPAPDNRASARDLSGSRSNLSKSTQNGHGRDVRSQRAPRPRVRAAVEGSSVEKWRLAISDDAFPPAPPGTPVPNPAALNLRDVPVPSWSVPVSAPERRLGDVSERWVAEQWADGATPNLHVPSRGHTAGRLIRHRNQFFKTKQCRFYMEPAGCIKGDRCNFIHESPDEGRRSSGLVVPAPAEVVSEGEMESGAESSVQGEMSACTSPTTEGPPQSDGGCSEQDNKKNFYPVTWRVVGGGVMMSGKREVCENFMTGLCPEGADCRYAHPDTNEEEYVGYAEPPPVYSPISPILSPVVFAYPVIYPSLSPSQPFALPAIPGPAPASLSPAPSISHPTSQNPNVYTTGRGTRTVQPSLSIAPIVTVQPDGLPYPYSPHRVVDGGTLAERDQLYLTDFQSTVTHDGGLYSYVDDGYLSTAARSVVRPVSTPPTRSDAGVARLFAAEMP